MAENLTGNFSNKLFDEKSGYKMIVSYQISELDKNRSKSMMEKIKPLNLVADHDGKEIESEGNLMRNSIHKILNWRNCSGQIVHKTYPRPTSSL